MTKELEEDKEMWDSFENFAKMFSEEELEEIKKEKPMLYETIMSLIWE